LTTGLLREFADPVAKHPPVHGHVKLLCFQSLLLVAGEFLKNWIRGDELAQLDKFVAQFFLLGNYPLFMWLHSVASFSL
jgi:hypothetical protein